MSDDELKPGTEVTIAPSMVANINAKLVAMQAQPPDSAVTPDFLGRIENDMIRVITRRAKNRQHKTFGNAPPRQQGSREMQRRLKQQAKKEQP